MRKYLLLVFLCSLLTEVAFSQSADSTVVKKDSVVKDTSYIRKRANRAALYSAILPGAGQFYNKKYWKIPIIYSAIGIPAYLYFDNKKIYNEAQYALTVTINGSKGDSLANVSPDFLPLVE